MNTINILDASDFKTEIQTKRVLVDFYKDNCAGCTMQAKALGVVEETLKDIDITILKVKMEDVGEDFFISLGLRQMPTIALFLHGEEVIRVSGYHSPIAISRLIDAHLISITL
ncbi:thioredoxin [Xanthomonas phage Carpasina]|uniref:Thioredoxin n=1 Tax=Xanthomonas phage Carpasina TaxID=2163636 RepID=A0A2S1GSS5_9CAUD|nr:thioredoxin [Xanthomonas phage Carpasina]AWD92450.1 thioredoxin [Xanthomonas phage Carpasina]